MYGRFCDAKESAEKLLPGLLARLATAAGPLDTLFNKKELDGIAALLFAALRLGLEKLSRDLLVGAGSILRLRDTVEDMDFLGAAVGAYPPMYEFGHIYQNPACTLLVRTYEDVWDTPFHPLAVKCMRALGQGRWELARYLYGRFAHRHDFRPEKYSYCYRDIQELAEAGLVITTAEDDLEGLDSVLALGQTTLADLPKILAAADSAPPWSRSRLPSTQEWYRGLAAMRPPRMVSKLELAGVLDEKQYRAAQKYWSL